MRKPYRFEISGTTAGGNKFKVEGMLDSAKGESMTNPRTQFVDKMSADQQARLIEQITERMKHMLVGFPPEVQGAILADLTAIWIAGHAPQVRKMFYEMQTDLTWALVEPNEKIIFGKEGHPAGHPTDGGRR